MLYVRIRRCMLPKWRLTDHMCVLYVDVFFKTSDPRQACSISTLAPTDTFLNAWVHEVKPGTMEISSSHFGSFLFITRSIVLPLKLLDVKNGHSLPLKPLDFKNCHSLPLKPLDVKNGHSLPLTPLNVKNSHSMPLSNNAGMLHL